LHTLELAGAVPQVVTHRVMRMLAAGPKPSARDQREFHRMGAEKVAAFMESWNAMGAQWMRWQTAMWLQWPTPLAMPWMEMAAAGRSPVHRRAVANAKRLGGVKGRTKR
jgi:hypothetical protein